MSDGRDWIDEMGEQVVAIRRAGARGRGVSAKSRSAAERVRVDHHISRLRATLMGLEVALRDRTGGPPGADVAQALLHTAGDLAMCLARIEAYERAEDDARQRAEEE